VRAGGTDGPGLDVKAVERARGERVAVQLHAPAVVVPDEERARVGVPVRKSLAGEVERDLRVVSRRCVEDERPREPRAFVHDKEARVAGERRPAVRVKPLPGTVPELRDTLAREVDHAHRRVPAVAVLAVRDRDERLVAREVGDVRALWVCVDSPRRSAVLQDVDRRALVAARATEDGDRSTDGEPAAVRRGEVNGERGARAARERLAPPMAELVPLRVVEPEDVLPARVEPRWNSEAGALGPVGQLAACPGTAIPGVDLELPALVGDVHDAVRVIAGPRRESETCRVEPLAPRRLGRDARPRHGHRDRV